MSALLLRGDEVKIGDDLLHAGRPYRVLSLEPYDTTPLGIDAPGARIARSHDGWAMTLLPAQRFHVLRAPTSEGGRVNAPYSAKAGHDLVPGAPASRTCAAAPLPL